MLFNYVSTFLAELGFLVQLFILLKLVQFFLMQSLYFYGHNPPGTVLSLYTFGDFVVKYSSHGSDDAVEVLGYG